MAVPYYRRSVSKKEYFYNFKKLEKEILSLLLRDFSIKAQEEDKVLFPDWLIDCKRREILKSLSDIAAYISRGSTFYPQTAELKRERIIFQNRAIQECFVLYDNIQFCSEILPIKNRNIYTTIANSIQKEILYLKYWKKYTNKIVISS